MTKVNINETVFEYVGKQEKEIEELKNSNVEKEKLLLFYRKTTLELKKEIEELKDDVKFLALKIPPTTPLKKDKGRR